MHVDAIVRGCVEVIKAYLPDTHWHVWLFGSQAAGTASESSDVDLAIVSDQAVPWKIMAAIKSRIDAIPTLRSIDVVDIFSADRELRRNILEHGKMLA